MDPLLNGVNKGRKELPLGSPFPVGKAPNLSNRGRPPMLLMVLLEQMGMAHRYREDTKIYQKYVGVRSGIGTGDIMTSILK